MFSSPVFIPAMRTATRPLLGGLVALWSATTLGSPSFSDALEAAWQRLPVVENLEQQRLAFSQRRPDWLQSAPELSLDYQQGDDRAGLATEWQAQLSLALVRPDQFGAYQTLASLERPHLAAQADEVRWRLAMQLQNWWWQWQEASRAVLRTQQQQQSLTTQSRWLTLLIQQGERPAFDLIELQQQAGQLEQTLQLLDSRIHSLAMQFQQWSGLEVLPTNWHFDRISERPLEQHPALQVLQQRLQQVQLQQGLSQSQAFAPTVSLGVKRVAEVQAVPAANVFQLGVSLPLGQAGYQARREAIQQVASLKHSVLEQRQALERERTVLAAQLPTLKRRYQQLMALSEDAEHQYTLQQQAWKSGSLPGFRWLQIQRSIWQLQQQADEAELDYLKSISRWNQLQGVIPQ